MGKAKDGSECYTRKGKGGGKYVTCEGTQKGGAKKKAETARKEPRKKVPETKKNVTKAQFENARKKLAGGTATGKSKKPAPKKKLGVKITPKPKNTIGGRPAGKRVDTEGARNVGKVVKKAPKFEKKTDPNSTGQKNLQALLKLGDLSDQISKEADKRRIVKSVPLEDPRILDETHLQVRKKPLTAGEFVKWEYMISYNQNTTQQERITKEMRDKAKKKYAELTKDKKKLVFTFDIDVNNPDYFDEKTDSVFIRSDTPSVVQVDSKGNKTDEFIGRGQRNYPVNFHQAQKAFFKAGDLGKVARTKFDYMSGEKDSKN